MLLSPLINSPRDKIVHAGIIDIILSTELCAVTSIATSAMSDLLSSAISGLFNWLRANEVPVQEGQLRRKEGYLDVFARCMARMHFDATVGGLLDVIRTHGREGSGESLYIRNWRNFQTQSQYRGEQIFRSMLAQAPVCSYLKENVFSRLGVTSSDRISLDGINLRIGNLNPFSLRSKCPLPDSFDLSAYDRDPVANGGWRAFSRLLLPQANPYSLERLALGEIQMQRTAETAADYAESVAGSGILSGRGSDVPGSGPLPGSIDPPCAVRGANGRCIIFSNIRTPGVFLRDTLGATAQQEMAWITSVDELSELVITHIAVRLRNRLLDLGADEDVPSYANDSSPSATPGPPTPTPTPFEGCIVNPPSASAYGMAVDGAIAEFRGANPGMFEDVGGWPYVISGNEAAFVTGVAAIVNATSLTARKDPNSGDEIQVKETNDFSEQFDVLASTRALRLPAGYAAFCVPAAF